ncbi:MAG TPA: PA2779 family protein [Burkholderiales bacterium]
MKSALKNLLCRFLAVAVLMLPFQNGQASMIGTGQAVSGTSVQLDRDVVLNFLNRSQTMEQLQALGLDPQVARDRVAAMTDDEVATLAGKVDELPAGGLVGLLIIVLLVVCIVVVVQRR